jgi:hypothetical protein
MTAVITAEATKDIHTGSRTKLADSRSSGGVLDDYTEQTVSQQEKRNEKCEKILVCMPTVRIPGACGIRDYPIRKIQQSNIKEAENRDALMKQNGKYAALYSSRFA